MISAWKTTCLVLTLFLVGPSLWAESAADIQIENPDTSVLLNSDFNQPIQVDAPPPVDLNAGRKSKSEDASAMAIFGAVMAMSQCAMLMAEAQKHPPGSAERTMLMSQAQQQCAQGAQNMESGKENDDQAQALTSQPNGQGQPQQSANNPRLATKPKSIDPLKFDTNLGDGEAAGEEFPTLGELQFPDTTRDDPTISSGGGGFARAPAAPPGLPVMDDSQLEINDELGDQGTGNTTGLGFGFGGFDSDAGAKFDQLSGLALGHPEGEGQGVSVAAFGASSAGGGSSGGSSGASGKKFDLSKLFGGGAGAGANAGLANQGQDIVMMPNQKNDPMRPKMNIFEYASLRYKKAAREERRIHLRMISDSPKAPLRQAALR